MLNYTFKIKARQGGEPEFVSREMCPRQPASPDDWLVEAGIRRVTRPASPQGERPKGVSFSPQQNQIEIYRPSSA